MKDRTQKGCHIKAWKKIAKRLDKRHTTSGFGHPRLRMVQPLSGLAFWPPDPVTRVAMVKSTTAVYAPASALLTPKKRLILKRCATFRRQDALQIRPAMFHTQS